MPWDGNIITDAALWAKFESYLYASYERNPYYLPTIKQWYEALDARRQKEDLRLAFVLVENEVSGKKFYAFRLNEQMFFSRSSAVLTLPHPRGATICEADVYPDQLVGIYLHDFGYKKGFFKACQAQLDGDPGTSEEKVEYLDRKLYPYCNSVVGQIKRMLKNNKLPGLAANDLGYWELRLAHKTPKNEDPHRDYGNKSPSGLWTRVVIHSLVGAGTGYQTYSGKNLHTDYPEFTCNVISPLGTTTSHTAVSQAVGRQTGEIHYQPWGVYHYAVGCEAGRAVLIKPDTAAANDWAPFRDLNTPWKQTPLMLAA
jgi:hypothetical protein